MHTLFRFDECMHFLVKYIIINIDMYEKEVSFVGKSWTVEEIRKEMKKMDRILGKKRLRASYKNKSKND